jgi:hypothetical protein
MPSEVFKVERPTVLREKREFAGDVSTLHEDFERIVRKLTSL